MAVFGSKFCAFTKSLLEEPNTKKDYFENDDSSDPPAAPVVQQFWINSSEPEMIEGLVQCHVHVGRVNSDTVYRTGLSPPGRACVAHVEMLRRAHVPDTDTAMARSPRHQHVDSVCGEAVDSLIKLLLPATHERPAASVP